MNILVVDDEFNICQSMAEKIRSFQFAEIQEVMCAGSGEEALETLKKTQCQLLITDICMSPMDGLTLVSKARELYPELICVLLSAFDEFSYARQGIQLQVRDYWLKPISEKNMRRSLFAIIQEYKTNEHKSRAVLDTVISGAIISGGKTLKDIFCNTPGYPGCGGYVLAWEGGCGKELAVPNFWICKLPNGQMLFACPCGQPASRDRVQLEQLARQVDRFCGVSLAGEDVALMYWQAEYALSMHWVLDDKKVLFYEDWESHAVELDAAVKETIEQAQVPDAVKELPARMARRQSGFGDFGFAVYVSRVYRELVQKISETGVKLPSDPYPGLGWQWIMEDILQKLAFASAQEAGLRRKNPIQWSVAYIECHYDDASLDMTVLADRLGMNYQYFSELFHKHVGKTFSEYLLSFRMKKACQFLLQGEQIADVAAKIGYQHTHSFTRAFKRMYGISPGAFREKNR